MSRLQTSALILLLGLVSGYSAHCWRDRPTGDVTRLKIQRDSLADQVLVLQNRERARTVQDSQRAAAAAELEWRAHASLAQTVALGAAVTRLSDSLQALLAGSDTVPRAVVEDLFARIGRAHGEEQRACIAAFSACDSALALERSRIITRDSTIGEQRVLLSGYQVQLDTAIAAAHLWSRRARRRISIGAGVGYSAVNSGGQMRAGPGVFAGLIVRF